MGVTYRQLLKDIHKDFILHVLLVGDLTQGPLYGSWRHRIGGEYPRGEWAGRRLGLGLDENGLIHDELFDVLSGHQLGMPIIDDLIDDLVDKHEILPDALLVEDPAEVAEDLHHPIQDVHDIGRGDGVLGRRDKEYSEFLGIEVVDPIHVEARGRISLPEFHLSEEDLTRLSPEVQADYSLFSRHAHLQSLVMMVSPLAERIKNWDSIFKYYTINKFLIRNIYGSTSPYY